MNDAGNFVMILNLALVVEIHLKNYLSAQLVTKNEPINQDVAGDVVHRFKRPS